jgi:putative solute:sodium symporter small subunit
MADPNALSHWRRTKKLMLVTIGAWGVLSIGVPILLPLLNLLNVPYLDLPVGFFMSTQGAPIAFLLLISLFARRQDRIDRDHFSTGGQ